MRPIKAVLGAAAVLCAANAQALDIDLFESALNKDGTLSNPALPGFDLGAALGPVTYTTSLSGAGSHFVGLFLDYEIDEVDNTFFNEFGQVFGAPSAGQSWEIDEPGFAFGDIYDNFGLSDESGSALDNSNGVPANAPDDVSMALGWDFVLAPNETAFVSFVVGQLVPGIAAPPGFYLLQTDPDSQASVYFRSSLSIEENQGPGVPEGGSTLVLLLGACAALAGVKVNRKG